MKAIHFFIGSLFLVITGITNAQPFASLNGKTLTLDNGYVKRVIQLETDGKAIVNKSYMLPAGKEDFLSEGSEDFYFEADGKPVTGLDNWKLVSVDIVSAGNEGSGAKITLAHPSLSLNISIVYLMYPELPIIRKKISFVNTGKQNLRLESLDIESIHFDKSGVGTECWVMNDYARQKSLGQFIGNAYDPVVVVHEVDQHRGVVLGNEAPGVMKRTAVFIKNNQLAAGLTHADQNFGFREWLKPGRPWESTWVFTAIYENSDDPSVVLNGAVNDYIRRHMGTRLSQIPEKPTFVYNTWEPFFHNINEKMIYDVIDAAADCGFGEFVIDDGWQDSYGDWGINKTKFPNGLKPVFDYIKSKGMKPGLWISIAAAEATSKVYREHPEWTVQKADGSPISLHADFDKLYDWESYSMCMTTGWQGYIKNVILNLVRENGLEYIKADFAVATGAYTTDKTRSGCHATDHPSHNGRNESMLKMYQATWQLFDDLHKEAPNLFIDCTFETMGALQLIDLDMCKHAEGNWLSNFSEKAPLGSLRIRQMSWWRSPVIPATAMVIGNQHLDDPDFEFSLMSLTGSLPIVLGDPRLLSKEKRAYYKSWADWLRNMQGVHNFMEFRQNLEGFGEPAEGCWDGFQRINSETKSGGIVGVFRQGAKEICRTVTVQFLDPALVYEVRKAPLGEVVFKATGKELSETGFKVSLDKKYDGAIFELSRVNDPQEPALYHFETIAGSAEGYANGSAIESLFRTPEGITIDSKGNLFTTEYWTTVVRKISVDGTVSVLAGKGNEPGNMNGTGGEARFNKPHGLVVVGDSAIYVCDMKNHAIRKVTYNGAVTTFAGTMGQPGIADGFRTEAAFNQPEAIAVNSRGELFVADSYNYTIRKIAVNGEVTTFAGIAGKAGYADGKGLQALFNKPLGIAIDAKDNVYVADSDFDGIGGNCLIRKISPDGIVSTLAGIPSLPGFRDGNARESQFDRPVGITVTRDGVIFIADTEADLIRKIDEKGIVSTIGGSYLDESFADGLGKEARFADPQAIVADREGNLYIADTFNHRIRKGTKNSF